VFDERTDERGLSGIATSGSDEEQAWKIMICLPLPLPFG
jgi:hypothetical protein